MPSDRFNIAWLGQPAVRAAATYLVLASLWVSCSDYLLALYVGNPQLAAKVGMAKGIAFVAVTTVLLYLLLRSWSMRAEAKGASAAPAAWGQRSLIGIFLGLVALVPLVGYGIVKLQEPRVEQSALDDLRAIGELKAQQVESWLNEWRADADALSSSPGFVGSIEHWTRTGNAADQRSILGMVDSLENVHHYEVQLADAAGQPLALEGKPAKAIAPPCRALVSEAIRSRTIQTSDLYRDDGGHIHLDIVVPLLHRESQDQRVAGVAILEAPVEQFLFPLIQAWPTPSPSGETVLLRRDGNDILFLNELRHRPGTALSFRLPIDDNPLLPAAAAVQNQKAVTVKNGVDYRNVPVLAATRPIQGTSWHLVTKLDRDEVLAPLMALVRWVSVLALVVVATVGVAVAMLWRQQQRANQLELLAQAQDKDKLLKLFYDLPFMGMAVTTPGSRRFIYANDRLCEILGYPRDELFERSWTDIVHPDDLDPILAKHQMLLAGQADSIQAEARYLRKDGQCGLAEANVRAAKGPDGRIDLLVAVVQDITERKRAEERTRQAATVFENTRDGVIIAGLDANILAVNKAFTDVTGYTEAEVVGRNPRILQSGRQGPEFYQTLWRCLSQAGQWQGEIWNRRKSGEIYAAWTTITAVRDETGNPTHYVGVFTDISQIKRNEEQLAHLTHYDALTGLPNRVLLQSRLAHALDRAQRHSQRAAVFFIGLDRFKTVNDSLGHLVGDELLVQVAQRLAGRVRQEDTLGRFGSDEFLLLLEPIGDPEEAASVARDLLDGLAAPFPLPDGGELYVGASIGISIFPEDSTAPTDLLRDADAAMHQAKEQGRHRFCFYTADMNANAFALLALEAALRRAIERGEFILHFQPKADLRNGRISGAEALIRWQREGMGLQMPAQFITLAEKTGLIVPIGNWVIDTACQQLRQWQEAGWQDFRLSVNVSGRQFHSGDLVAVVAEALKRHGVPPDCLELEVTESVLLDNPERTLATLAALKRLGVKLSLDDFGTGYSSFAYLSRFPIDSLKIDQSFVRDIVTEPQAALIAVSIIDLAHRLRLKVVAEGVETESQLGYLRLRNCDEMQGYYFAQPMSAEAFESLAREGRTLALPGAGEETPSRTLLLVDDEPNVISSLRRLLRQEGYRVLTAASGREALELLATTPVQVILSDQRMPEMTGTEFLRRVKEIHPDTVRIVLSGYTDLDSVTLAVNEGAIYKFLNKPWDDAHLRERIRDAFLYHEAIIKPRAAQAKA